MRRRVDNDFERNYGYGDRDRSEQRDYDMSDRGYGRSRDRGSSFRGSSDYGDDRYFGGGRQYGEGYSEGRFSQNREDRDRGFRTIQNYGDDANYFTDLERGREYRYREAEHIGPRDYGYGRSGYQGSYPSRYGTGLYGGGIGGYSGGGYQGYDRGSDRPGDYRTSRRYSPDYPESESGYYSGRSGRRNERGWWDKTSDEVAAWFGDEEAERRREMDRRYDGGYRGKGPKGYMRSDDRIKEDVSDRLEDHSYLDASDIEIEVNKGDVVLSGTVESRYAKRLAEDLADNCSGVRNVENRIRVDSEWYENRYQKPSSSTDTTSNISYTQARSATGK